MVSMVVNRGRRARRRVLAIRRCREKIKVCAQTCAYNASQMPREVGAYNLVLVRISAMVYFIRAATIEDVVGEHASMLFNQFLLICGQDEILRLVVALVCR